MRMLQIPLVTAALTTATAATAIADTTVLNVPSDQYPTMAAAVAAANKDTNLNNDYVISIAPGTYTNDTTEVDRPMTIQAAVPGSAVILNETAPLPTRRAFYSPLRA
ncbi:MAG: hypothetical protein JO007_20020 [Alphaproteobacteria bacterium]|nr:hypothetical protein [Alphaproteobacteria bacterium]